MLQSIRTNTQRCEVQVLCCKHADFVEHVLCQNSCVVSAAKNVCLQYGQAGGALKLQH